MGLSKISNFVSALEKKFVWIAGFILMFTMILLCSEAFARYVFSSPIPSYYDVLRDILIPYMVFLSISYVFSSGLQVRVTLLTNIFPKKVNQIITLISNSLTSILFMSFAYGALIRSIKSYKLREFASNIYAYPMGATYIVVTIGSIPLIFELIKTAITMEQPDSGELDS